MPPSLRMLVLGVIVLAAHPVRAQYAPMDFTQQTFTAMNLASSYTLSQSILQSSVHTGARPPRAKAAKAVTAVVSKPTTGRGSGVSKLAATYPAEQRAATVRSFTALLAAYPKVESMLGVPAGDVAAAIALLVVGSFEAARDTNVDPALYKPVILQLRDALASNAAFAKASATERRELYEQMAVLGMLITLSRADLVKHPDPDTAQRVRDAANGYLRAFSLDPDSLQITESGISIVPGRAP